MDKNTDLNLTGKKVLVIGCGISGIAAAELLLDQGIEPALYDGSTRFLESDIRAKSEKLSGTAVFLGEQKLKEKLLKQFSAAVLSPGVPVDSPLVEKMRKSGMEIWGEVELAYRFAKGKTAAITGTNGKTTTTALCGAILQSFYPDVQIAGNIGIPYTSVAAKTSKDTVTVLEVSSFQLETTEKFCPEVSVILNITPDHLNRHHSMECYTAVKQSITKNQKPPHVCVLNYEDKALRKFGETLDLNVIYFSSRRRLERGLYLEDGAIYLAGEGGMQKVIDTADLHLLGIHNYENVMAAVACALAFQVPMEKIVRILKSFQAVEHRIEYVAEIAGVRYYNDSKGTNPDAAIQGIRAMNRPVYLIGGGYDKQSEYDAWIDAFDGKVRELVLIGETKEKIAQCARKKGFENLVFCDTLQQAVTYCHAHAGAGEAVLLSPACASWDMFQNYEERGNMFKEAVRGFQELKLK